MPAASDQCAALFLTRSEPREAVRLWNAADALRSKLGTALEWFVADERAHWQAQAGRLFSPQEYAVAREDNATLTPETASALALAHLGEGTETGARGAVADL